MYFVSNLSFSVWILHWHLSLSFSILMTSGCSLAFFHMRKWNKQLNTHNAKIQRQYEFVKYSTNSLVFYHKHMKNGHITKLNNLPAIQDTRTAEYSKDRITLTCMESKGLSKSSSGI